MAGNGGGIQEKKAVKKEYLISTSRGSSSVYTIEPQHSHRFHIGYINLRIIYSTLFYECKK